MTKTVIILSVGGLIVLLFGFLETHPVIAFLSFVIGCVTGVALGKKGQ